MKYLSFVLIVFGLALCPRNADSQALTTLVQFNGFGGTADGAVPSGGLTLSGTTLYGTTTGGGRGFLGSIFSVGTDGSDYQDLYSFSGGTANGLEPPGNLTLIGTSLYGTVAGGAYDYGALFSVGTDGSSYRNVVAFTGTSGAANGYGPGDLALSGSTFYGATGGGGYGFGNVYRVGIDGTNYQNLINFTGTAGTANGKQPNNVILNGGVLYGMTYHGGVPGFAFGNVYSANTDGTDYQNLVSFTGSPGTANGAQPAGSLVIGGDTLYGMSSSGGTSGMGNVFRVMGTNYQNLLSFTGTGGAASGQTPSPGLTLSGTTLYGMTRIGGAYGYGNIFSVGIDGSGFQNLYSFTGGSDGAYPQGSLTLSGGTLFGTTAVGGIGTGYNGEGTVFAFGLPPGAVLLTTSTWSQSAGGSWNDAGNWSPGIVPDGPGWQAVLGGTLAASDTITLDGDRTLSSLVFNNGAAGYTVDPGSGGTLILSSASNPAGSQVLVVAGSHAITAPMTIAGGSLTISESNGSSLVIAGNINDDNGAESLALNGDGSGQLVLSGTNNYGGGTNVEAGTLIATDPAALPDGGNLNVGSAAASSFMASAIPAHATVVPEPCTLALIGLSAMAFAGRKASRVRNIAAQVFRGRDAACSGSLLRLTPRSSG